jgi:molybdopterin-containing oxidoreductase family membrane subunit
VYHPTIWDWLTFIGTLGFFTLCFILFCRILPVISIFEMRELVDVEKHRLAGPHPVHPSELASGPYMAGAVAHH